MRNSRSTDSQFHFSRRASSARVTPVWRSRREQFDLERRQSRQTNQMFPAGLAVRDVVIIADARGDRLLDGVTGMTDCIRFVLAERRDLRKSRAGDERSAVVVRLQRDAISKGHFRPRSFKILLTSPLPSSFRLPCIGICVLRSPRRTVTWPEPPLCVSNVQRCRRHFDDDIPANVMSASRDNWRPRLDSNQGPSA